MALPPLGEPPRAAPPPPPAAASWGRWLGWGVLRHAGWGLLAATAGLAVLSYATFHLRCESFGCTFVGVAWVALAALWALALCLAAVVRWAQRRRGLPGRLSNAALAALALLGAGHLLYWLARTA